VMDLLMSFPPLLLAVAVAAALGTGTRSIIIALGVVYLPRIVRVTRGISLSVVAQEYVLAARALGSPRWRLILRTVLPNCLSVVVVQLSLYFAEVLLAEAALSFLGLGEPPPTPTWGNVLQDSQKYIRNAPWIAIFPGCAIAVSVLGLNLFGDAVRTAMDPACGHERGRRHRPLMQVPRGTPGTHLRWELGAEQAQEALAERSRSSTMGVGRGED